MRYIIVAATCHGRGLGKDGGIPWSVPEDLRMFSIMTKGRGNNAIVMGRATWESLPKRPLPGRHNIVLSRQVGYDAGEGCTVCASLEAVHEHCLQGKYETVWVAGGAHVYSAFLEAGLVDRCAITFIDADHECDTFFPTMGEGWAVRMARPIKTKSGVYAELRHLVRIKGEEPPNDQNTDCQ